MRILIVIVVCVFTVACGLPKPRIMQPQDAKPPVQVIERR